MSKRVGILALQGDFHKHGESIKKLGHQPVFVRDKSELEKCESLIIPGGESTTFLNLIEQLELRDPILKFNNSRPIMGTCAGLIILSREVDSLPFEPLKLINIKAGRNAYGRQINSFISRINLMFDDTNPDFDGVFIRAPRIISFDDSVRILAYHEKEVVMAANDRVLVATFHPELTDDTRIHRYFLNYFS